MLTRIFAVVCLLILTLVTLDASAAAAATADPPVIDDPPAPLAPAMVSRDDRGRATMRAVRVQAPPRIDGRLDDEIYARVPAVDGFIQQLPREGLAATEPTAVWVLFDEDNVYIAARCLDSHPERSVANELRRDHRNIFQLNDSLSVVLDTFYDRRNGFFFQTNPLGAVRDQAIKDGSQSESWNTVWDVKSARIEHGYTVEMRIPFKSLRYQGTGEQVWGINFRRVVKWKNEVSNLTLVPASYGSAGVSQMATAATLVGIETPAQAKNLELKPYAVTSSTTDLTSATPFRNDVKPAVGLDTKYGLTNSLTAVTAIHVRVKDGQLVLHIDDAGPGVPVAERVRVFERFHRGGSIATPGLRKGTGLGLALAREHIALHGGTLELEDSPDGGARFVITIPASAQ